MNRIISSVTVGFEIEPLITGDALFMSANHSESGHASYNREDGFQEPRQEDVVAVDLRE
jgi:hypothetical protein